MRLSSTSSFECPVCTYHNLKWILQVLRLLIIGHHHIHRSYYRSRKSVDQIFIQTYSAPQIIVLKDPFILGWILASTDSYEVALNRFYLNYPLLNREMSPQPLLHFTPHYLKLIYNINFFFSSTSFWFACFHFFISFGGNLLSLSLNFLCWTRYWFAPYKKTSKSYHSLPKLYLSLFLFPLFASQQIGALISLLLVSFIDTILYNTSLIFNKESIKYYIILISNEVQH